MLFYVPRMYTETEIKRKINTIPKEFIPKSIEFWNYVEEKLRVYQKKINWVYREEIWKSGKEGLKQLAGLDKRNHRVIKKLMENGAKLEAIEDELLVHESRAWIEAFEQQQGNKVISDFYDETLRERAATIVKRVKNTLREGELGALFIDPSRRLQFDKTITVIKMYRFNPLDELKKWQIQQQLNKK